MKLHLAIVSTALLLLPVNHPLHSQSQPLPKALVLFGNGVFRTKPQANDSAMALRLAFKERYFPLLTNKSFDTVYPFSHSYNHTACIHNPPDPLYDLNCLLDLQESLQQAAQAGGFGFSYQDFWRFVLGVPLGSPDLLNLFSEAFKAEALTLDPLSITYEDLGAQVSRYRNTIDGGTKVLLVAHSQGNFFGNQAYDFLSPTQQASFGMVSVATPASFVAGGGPYTTLLEDFIHFFPSALPSNVSSPFCGNPFTCHDFIGSYLANQASREKILGDMMTVLDSLAEPIPPLPSGFTRITNMQTPRSYHCAVRLSNGKVLLVGGSDGGGFSLTSAELYDPASHTFTPTTTNMITPRGRGISCALLDDGRVLVAGGATSRFFYTSTAEVYDPVIDGFIPVGDMTTPRAEGWQMFAVPGGALLFGGTYEGGVGTATAAVDRFNSASASFTRVGTLAGARRDYTAQMLSDGTTLLVGGVCQRSP